ncbi:MAG: hypothetical protein RDU14_16880 [Melioribacteraceae bacterium]|nr:hypothetical protein [Melioribacteraceae bacterium]
MTDSSLLNITNQKVNDNTQLQQIFAQADQKTNNLVASSMTFGARPELVLGFTLITVNTTLEKYTYNQKEYDQKSNGDIFLVDKKSKRYALHLRKLKEIAQAAGVEITHQKEIDHQYDDNGKTTYVKFELGWKMVSIDGSTKSGLQIGEYSYLAQVEKHKKDDGNVNEDFIEKQRGDGAKLAMSNALGRAIKDALPKMKGTFTIDELKKPFLVPCVIKDLSKLLEKYPDVEKMLLAKELGISNLIYSHQNEMLENHLQNNLQLNEPSGEKDNQPGIKPDKDKVEQPEPLPSDTKVAAAQVSEPTLQEKNKITAKEFQEQPENVRVKKIEDLLIQKGKSWTGKSAIEKYTPAQHVKFIEDLLNLPDAIVEEKVFN